MDEYQKYVWSVSERMSIHDVADAAELLTHKARVTKTPLFAMFNDTRMEARPDKTATWCLHSWFLNEAQATDAYARELRRELCEAKERLQMLDDTPKIVVDIKAVTRAAELRGAQKILACETVLDLMLSQRICEIAGLDEDEFVFVRRDRKIHEAIQLLKAGKETTCASSKSDAD